LESVEIKFQEVQTTEEKLSEVINNIDSKLCGYHKEITQAIASNFSSANNSASTSTPTSISEESAVRLASSLAVEQKEKEKRQLNVIVHNLVEPTASEGANRKKEGIKKCSSVFQSYLGSQVSITNAICLGKKTDKPRLLKLTLSSTQEKSLALQLLLTTLINHCNSLH